MLEVEGALFCAAAVGALSWVGLEVEGATRVEEESLMAMLCEVDWAIGRCNWLRI